MVGSSQSKYQTDYLDNGNGFVLAVTEVGVGFPETSQPYSNGNNQNEKEELGNLLHEIVSLWANNFSCTEDTISLVLCPYGYLQRVVAWLFLRRVMTRDTGTGWEQKHSNPTEGSDTFLEVVVMLVSNTVTAPVQKCPHL